jgi:hypothetical protein
MSSSDSRLHGRRDIFYNVEVQDVRRIMNRRRDRTVQIRKERKENILRKRRLLDGTSGCLSDTDSSEKANEQQQLDGFRRIIVVYCSTANSKNDNYLALNNLRDVFRQASSSIVKSAMQGLLQTVESSESNNNEARVLVARLLYDLTTSDDVTIHLSVLSIVLQISSVTSSVTARSPIDNEIKMSSSSSAMQMNDNYDNGSECDEKYSYYGRSSMKWTDLLLEPQSNGFTLVTALLEILTRGLTTCSTELIETTCNIIGNLIQDETSSASSVLLNALIPQYWQLFIQNLPMSSYCCAAILRVDSKHYGVEFCSIQGSQENINQQGLTPAHLCSLLENEKTAIDAAWILDGLCRREDDAVDFVCHSPLLLSSFVQQLHNRTIMASSDFSCGDDVYEFLIPSLRAFGNIGAACQGKYVPLLLSEAMNHFLSAINILLELPLSGKTSIKFSSIFTEAAYVAGCLLVDAGWPNHPSTTIAVRNLLPRLKAVLLRSLVTFEIRTAAISAVANALREPPSPGSEQHNPFSLKAISNDILTSILWNNDGENIALLRTLVDLLRTKDSDAVLSSLQVVDRLLRTGTESETLSVRKTFEECDGVEAIEQIGDVFPSTSTEALLAADLIDEFFDDGDHDDNNDGMYHNNSVPVVQGNHYVFGLPDAGGTSGSTVSCKGMVMSSPHKEKPLSAALLLSTMPVGAKGRGKPLPSWMTHVNSTR